MPGLLGFIGKCAESDRPKSSIHRLCHFETYSSRLTPVLDGVCIGQVWRRSTDVPGSSHLDETSGVSAFINGWMNGPGVENRPFVAEDVVRNYLEGTFRPETYNGGFIVCIVDRTGSQDRDLER